MRRFYQIKATLTTSSGRSRTARSLVIGLALGCAPSFALGAQVKIAMASAGQPSVDKEVPLPPSQPLEEVRQDTVALAAVRSYREMIGKKRWGDLAATGEMIPAALRSRGGTATQNAALQILGSQGSRLDVQTPKGAISIRMDGAYGAMQPPGTHVIPMNPGDAVSGLLAFPQLQDPSFPAKDVSLIDRGTVAVDGIQLHRITVEVPWSSLVANEAKQRGVSITDLYFDPTSSLLVKSVNLLQGTDPRLARYIKEVTYGDYQTVDGVLLPFLITESLNGKPVWTLKLNQVQLNRGIREAEFHF